MAVETDRPLIENRASFLSRLEKLNHENTEFIMYAYDIAKVSHRGTFREGGDRYFEHPRFVSLILIDECKVTDPSLIAGSLLHDVAEDTPAFGSYIGKNYLDWAARVRDRITNVFGEEVAEIVLSVTKPPKGLEDVGTSQRSHEIYDEVLNNVSSKGILVKMADRLHNLRTLSDTPV